MVDRTSIAVTALASVTLIAVALIGSQCSIKSAEVDGKQAAACVRSGGSWEPVPGTNSSESICRQLGKAAAK